jgi:predicted SnoaL-like aldol condensation-catalyzing enzyme
MPPRTRPRCPPTERLAFADHDVEKAMSFLGDTYVQHNPWVADGPAGFRRFIQFIADRFPKARNEVKMVIAEGDLVALHVHSVRVPGTPGRNVMDIFRVKDGKVVEHWDAVQDIQESIYPPINDNGLF